MTIFLSPPPDFKSGLDVAGCCCFYEGKILLLKRAPDKLEGSTWNLPGGKVEKGENLKQAAQRELEEEAGIYASHLEFMQSFYIRKKTDFSFHLFFVLLTEKPKLTIHLAESSEACFVTQEESLTLPLIGGGQTILDYCFAWEIKRLSSKK